MTPYVTQADVERLLADARRRALIASIGGKHA